MVESASPPQETVRLRGFQARRGYRCLWTCRAHCRVLWTRITTTMDDKVLNDEGVVHYADFTFAWTSPIRGHLLIEHDIT